MIINVFEKILNIKIVYYGPALSGKTTSFTSLCDHFGLKDKVTNIENTVDRTLFFDYGIITFQNQQWTLKIYLYSTTGQDFYKVTRPITLKGVDGVFFIVNSQENAFERNLISWFELYDLFKDSIKNLPMVVCFNKQDLPEKFPPKLFLKEIEKFSLKSMDIKYTIASNGEGILLSFERMLELIFQNLINDGLLKSATLRCAES
ncbi:MAG: ATP/GTP-binding protein [Promethearchaeota archaeon]